MNGKTKCLSHFRPNRCVYSQSSVPIRLPWLVTVECVQRSVHTGLVLDMEYVGIVHTLHSVRGEPAAVGEYFRNHHPCSETYLFPLTGKYLIAKLF